MKKILIKGAHHTKDLLCFALAERKKLNPIEIIAIALKKAAKLDTIIRRMTALN